MILGDSTGSNADTRVQTRLIKFLRKDKMGIRRYVLKLFLQTKNYTTSEIYEHLTKQGFGVNYRGIYALVGQMHTRLGILQIHLKNDRHVYSLKENHRDIVKMVLNGTIR